MVNVEEVKREVKKWLDEGFVVVLGWVDDVLALAATVGERGVEAYMVHVTLCVGGLAFCLPSGILVAPFRRTEKLRRLLKVDEKVFKTVKLLALEPKGDTLEVHACIEEDNWRLASQLCEELEARLSEMLGKQLEQLEKMV